MKILGYTLRDPGSLHEKGLFERLEHVVKFVKVGKRDRGAGYGGALCAKCLCKPVLRKRSRHTLEDEVRKDDGRRATAAVLAVHNDGPTTLEVPLDETRKVYEHAAVPRHARVHHERVVREGLRVRTRTRARHVEDGHAPGLRRAKRRAEERGRAHVREVAAHNDASGPWIAHAEKLRQGLVHVVPGEQAHRGERTTGAAGVSVCRVSSVVGPYAEPRLGAEERRGEREEVIPQGSRITGAVGAGELPDLKFETYGILVK